jgi:hypothetical protein
VPGHFKLPPGVLIVVMVVMVVTLLRIVPLTLHVFLRIRTVLAGVASHNIMYTASRAPPPALGHPVRRPGLSVFGVLMHARHLGTCAKGHSVAHLFGVVCVVVVMVVMP